MSEDRELMRKLRYYRRGAKLLAAISILLCGVGVLIIVMEQVSFITPAAARSAFLGVLLGGSGVGIAMALLAKFTRD